MGLINLDLEPIADAIQSLADAVDRVAAVSEESLNMAKRMEEEMLAKVSELESPLMDFSDDDNPTKLH